MPRAFSRDRLGEAVHFTAVTDPKFKHNRLSAHLYVPLDRGTVTENALVPFLLRRGFAGCETHTKLARRLGMLYGAWVNTGVIKYGCHQLITLSVQSPDDRFALGGEPLTADCAALLGDMLLKPLIGDGGFDAAVTELEKSNLRDDILAEINDKRSYALARCIARMDADRPSSLRALGYAEDIPAITPLWAAEAYRRLLDTAHMELLFVGSGDPEPAKACFRQALGGLRRSPHASMPAPFRRAADAVSRVTETMEVSQAKLVMGFRAGTQPGDAALPTRMMTALWGGTPSSLLFTNVREKLSLCYYCSARFDRATGVIALESGVSTDKADEAQAAMLAQLEALAGGDFSDELMSHTLRMLQTSLNTAGDSPGALEAWTLTELMEGRRQTPEAYGEALAAVTREQIIAAAKAVTQDTVYLLREREEAAE